MKVLIYGVRDYEESVMKELIEQSGMDADLVLGEDLTEETLSKAQGYDGISIQQVKEIKSEHIFETLKGYGVKVISSRTAGVDMINLEAASKHGIIVTNVPRYSPNAIAELAVSHTLTLLRNCNEVTNRMKKNDFRWKGDLLGKEIRSLTVGVVGTGKIGLTSARIFKGFGANVIGYDLYKSKDAEEVLTYTKSLEELLEKADVVTLHTPSLDSTRYMINKDTLKLMKKDAFLINTSRGDVIKTEDLIEALKAGEIAGAGLDTLENEGVFINKTVTSETIKGSPVDILQNMDNVVVTPHLGFFTETAIENIVSKALENVKETITTGDCQCRVN